MASQVVDGEHHTALVKEIYTGFFWIKRPFKAPPASNLHFPISPFSMTSACCVITFLKDIPSLSDVEEMMGWHADIACSTT
jgi:hypothetical protein